MSQKAKKLTVASVVMAMLCCVLPVCVSPEAIKTDIQGIRNDMGQLKNVAEQLSVWRKTVSAENIQYSGAGWVVVGTGVMALIFVGAGLLLVRAFMRRGNMLAMLTLAVKNASENSPDFMHVIKSHLKRCVREGHFCEADRKNLEHFTKKKALLWNKQSVCRYNIA